MTIDEIRNELESRLLRVKSEIESRKNDLGNPVLFHHYKGYIEAADGMFGEREFLEGLIAKLK